MNRMRFSTFSKLLFLIVALLLPIIGLYFYSNATSIHVVRKEIESSKINQLTFFSELINNALGQLSLSSNMLSSDPEVQRLNYLPLLYTSYEANSSKKRIQDKIYYAGVSNNWISTYSIYAMKSREVLSTRPYASFGDLDPARLSLDWHYESDGSGGYFIRHYLYPYSKSISVAEADVVVEAVFSARHIRRLLATVSPDNSAFLVQFGENREDDRYIAAPAEPEKNRMRERLAGYLHGKALSERGNAVVRLDKQRYSVTYVYVPAVDFYLVDYMPLEETLSPITKSRNLFYGSVFLLLLLGTAVIFQLYRKVQLPIKLLIRNVTRLRRGDYSAHIEARMNNEFDFLFDRFNDMAGEIKQLIDTVYEEKLRSQEARLRQLQSQINPHFLYNSLAFIKSMAELGDRQAVVAMALNLSKYYRYTTRTETIAAPLGEEVRFLEHYLEIQNLQTDRLQYDIRFDEDMLPVPVPRLILQPIVENAIVHGIEPREGRGMIRIVGFWTAERHVVVIEDNGEGLPEDKLDALNRSLSRPVGEPGGFGTWNVHQRLLAMYGPGSGLTYGISALGGLKATLTWSRSGG